MDHTLYLALSKLSIFRVGYEMKRLTGKKVFTTLKSVSYHFINSSDDAFRCVPYHKSSCENLLRIHYGFTYMSKRTLRKNASKIAVKDFSDKQPFDSLEQFEQTSEFKSSRLPPKVPLKNTQQLFTVSNVQSEEIEREANSESEPQETKALSLARKIRKENAKAKNPFAEKDTEELDPVQRAVKDLKVNSLDRLSDEELAGLIRRKVIYADHKLVIFNKPYGLPMHDGDNTAKHIRRVLPIVSKMVYGVDTDIPLTICNRLDKFTTGICVTSADNEMTGYIQKLFREHKILKKYWAMTIYSPDPTAGVVDIPLDRSVVAGDSTYARMVAKPEVRYDALTNRHIKKRSRGQIAITHYSQLDWNNGLALVELQPMTTIKHQLRVHLADGLDCPILGDHKYSHFGKLAPQILPTNVLKRFGIPFSKTRVIPMHLHLQSILIPGMFPGNKKPNLLISARLPFHMKKTMKKFGLKPGIPTKWKGVGNFSAPKKTAEPRDPDNDLYRDPTEEKQKEDTSTSQTDDFDKSCFKVGLYRESYLRVHDKSRR